MNRMLVLALLALAGCATTRPCAPDIEAGLRHPPAECMLPCDPLTPPAGPTLAETYQAAVGAALNQKACARRHRCLVDWVNAR